MPPMKMTAPANPAETCTSMGRMEFSHFKPKVSSQRDLLRACSCEMASLSLSPRSAGALAGPSEASDCCMARRVGKFARTCGAGFKMTGDLLHLLSADGTVKVGGERSLALLANLRGHNVTTSLDVSGSGSDLLFVGSLSLSLLSNARRADRPRVSRDLTVPRFTLRTSEISS